MSAKLNSAESANLSPDDALNLAVTRAIFGTAVEGFDIPYGDMAMLNSNWSYRPSPYAVAQNTGAFVEIPSFLESSHALETVDDAQSYLARMSLYAGQLDGESERVRRDGEAGVILPDFLMAKTLGQLKGGRAQDPKDWGIVKTLAAKFKGDAAKAIEICLLYTSPSPRD